MCIRDSISAGTISPSAQTICSGATPTLLTGTATPSFLGTASVTFEWQSSIDNWTTYTPNLATTENFQPGGLFQQTQFRRVDKIERNSKTCSATTNIITVNINNGPGGVLFMNIPSTGVNSDTATRSICEGDNAQFTISGGPVAPNRSYEWILDGNPLALTNTPTLNYSAFTGVQTFEVNVYDRSLQDSVTLNPLACSSATNSITVTSIAAVNPVLTSDAINETFCDGENVTFTATPIAGVTNYRFERNGGIIIYDGPSNTTSNSVFADVDNVCLLYTSPSPRDQRGSRMASCG